MRGYTLPKAHPRARYCRCRSAQDPEVALAVDLVAQACARSSGQTGSVLRAFKTAALLIADNISSGFAVRRQP
jgi:hypothetical protein